MLNRGKVTPERIRNIQAAVCGATMIVELLAKEKTNRTLVLEIAEREFVRVIEALEYLERDAKDAAKQGKTQMPTLLYPSQV